jgi:hypothetical protein
LSFFRILAKYFKTKLRHESLLRIVEVLLPKVAVLGVSLISTATAKEPVHDGLTAGNWAGTRNTVNTRPVDSPGQTCLLKGRTTGTDKDAEGPRRNLAERGDLRAEVISCPKARSNSGS